MSVTDPEWLKAELAKPGRSQSGLARYLGLDASIVNKIVNGKRDLKAREIEEVEAYLANAPALIGPFRDPPSALSDPRAWLRHELQAADITVDHLAERSGVHRATIFRLLEEGTEAVPSMRTVNRLAEALRLNGPSSLIGAKIRAARNAAGLSAADLAAAAGLSESATRNHENGTNGVPLPVLTIYAERLGVSVASFFDAEPVTPPPSIAAEMESAARAAKAEAALRAIRRKLQALMDEIDAAVGE